MRLEEYLTRRGNWLFRWRSYTPLLLLPLFWLERDSFYYPFHSHHWDLAYEFACFTVSLAGITVRIMTIGYVPKGTSGRNSSRQRADNLNTTGMYSIVRNPLYLGNYLIFLGATLMTQSYALVIVNTLMFGFAYLPIILREEEFLTEKYGNLCYEYAASTPCFVPRLNLWCPPALPFSIRMVLRQEHDTWMSTMVVYFFLEHFRKYNITQSVVIDWAWATPSISVFVIWLVLKILKKWTGVLKERPIIEGHV